MTSGWLPFALLPPLAIWWWLRRLGIGASAERLALAAGFGLGVSSAAFFVARWAGVTPSWYLPLESGLALAGIAAAIGIRGRPPAPPAVLPAAPGSALARAVNTGVLLAAAVLAAIVIRHGLLSHPEGTWDAWAIWNARAAFLMQSSEAWRHGFDPALMASHPDYPLLLPGAVARGWVFAAAPHAWVPAAIAVAFTVATAVVVTGSTWTARGPGLALASLGVLMTPDFLAIGTAQIADVPLAFFAVAAVTLMAQQPRTSSRVVLAGLACGCAAWTKNEGLVLALVWPVLVVATTGWRQGRGAAADVAADLAIGMGPLLVLLALFKLWLAPPNDVVSGLMAPGVLGYWGDTTRVMFVAREMGRSLYWWGGWPPPLSAVAALAMVALVISRRGASPPAGLLVAAQVLAFFAIYVMTPHSVAWHIQTSWPRLVAQMWPTMVWWAFARSAHGILRR